MTTILKIKPVGGVGQIGSNMTLIEYENHKVLIDAGILFPYEDFFDIDYLIPDLSSISELDTLVITHGHEDHIGAVYNIIQKFPNIKIHAPRFAAALIRKKLEFNKLAYPISIYQDNDILKFNDLEIHPIHVNHSIPDTKGLFIKHDKLSLGVFFISDFKIDFKTKYEAPFDFPKLKKLSQNLKKKILMVDSTNITSSTLETPSEFDLIPSFEKIISEANNRIFITLFSSNVHRVKTIIDMAEKYQFKVVPYGRSMISYLKTAIEEKIIPDPDKIIQMSDATKNDQENVIVLLSGCQGDFLGTFRRVSMNEDSQFKIRATDTFVLSSKPIPGNEKKISFLMNKIAEFGAKVISPQDLPIHVSGHPGRIDLLKIYQEYAPTDIIPIHGETYFIREHVDYIKSVYPQAIPHYVQNHDELHIDEHLNIKFHAGEKKDPVIYHGKHIVLEREKISERRKLACNGSIFLSLKTNPMNGKISNYNFTFLGIPSLITPDETHFKNFFSNELNRFDYKDPEKSKEELRIALRRYFDSKIGYKPTTIVHMI